MWLYVRKVLWGWDGRLDRGQFIIGQLLVAAPATLLMMVLLFAFGTPAPGGGFLEDARTEALIYGSQIVTAPFVASMAVRRAHDLGKSGRLLLWGAAYCVALQVMMLAWPAIKNSWIDVVIAAPILIGFVCLFVVPGAREPNVYGDPP